MQLGGLVLNAPQPGTFSFYSPDVSVDGTSTIEIGTAGGAAVGAITIDAGKTATSSATAGFTGSLVDNGILSITGGMLTQNGSVSGSGLVQIGKNATWVVNGTVSGSGVVQIGKDATWVVNGSVAATDTIAFLDTGAALSIGTSFSYTGTASVSAPYSINATITGFQTGDSIILAQPVSTATYTAGAGTNPGTLVLSNATGTVETLHLAGNFTGKTFFLSPTTTGGASVSLLSQVQAMTLTGTVANDTLVGGAGNDTINGGAGADSMVGGAGNDSYYVDNPGDIVTEAAGGGTDTVYASVNYTLSANTEVEALRANAATGVKLTGNSYSHTLVGNAGNDTLVGGVGNDTINGGAGADSMAGGAGNDTYYVDNPGDVVTEAAGGGTDTVYANVSYALRAGSEIEFLRANAGATGLSLTGNEFNNTIVGGTGNDMLSGGGGNDTYYVGNAGDVVNEAGGGGIDTVYASVSYALSVGSEVEFLRANAGATGVSLAGNEFDNTIVGGTGNDTLSGGAGNDTYYVGNSGDIVTEAVGGGTDTVYASVDYTLSATTEVETFRANAATGVKLTGNAYSHTLVGGSGSDTLVGGAGNDTINGGAGADSMAGGAGNDTYYVDNSGDIVAEAVGGGTDTVYANVIYTLRAGSQIEFLPANAGGLACRWQGTSSTTRSSVAQVTTRSPVAQAAIRSLAGWVVTLSSSWRDLARIRSQISLPPERLTICWTSVALASRHRPSLPL